MAGNEAAANALLMSMAAASKKPKNVLGLDFDIPDELSQLLA